jgi:hypothetical protein
MPISDKSLKYSTQQKVYIHPLCPIKEFYVCVFIIAVFCDVQSMLHSYAISIIHAKFHLLKTKTAFMVNLFMYFSSSHININ